MTVVLGAANVELTATAIRNDASPASDGTALYLLGHLGSKPGLTSWGRGPKASAVDAFTIGGDGVRGWALFGATGVGVHGGSVVGTAGVFGESGGVGVLGSSQSVGVEGQGADGVRGFTGAQGGHGVLGVSQPPSAGTGVFGYANTGVGVMGISSADFSIGVYGETLGRNGAGVYASAPNDSSALEVVGKASFSRSGIVTIPAGASQITNSVSSLTSDSLVLATLQQNRPGVWVRAAVPDVAANSFTIFLNQAVVVATNVAWFLLD
jgi:hypothetical protein